MIVLFSDLDGTLLDHHSYSYEASLPGMKVLNHAGGKLVLVSSKTRREMELLHRELSLDTPFIFENGGGYLWPGEETEPVFLGRPVHELEKCMPDVERVLGVKVLPLPEMSTGEVMEKTGLPEEKAGLARQRETGIPFLVQGTHDILAEDIERANRALASSGILLTRGGRFFHVIDAEAGKGTAVKKIVDLLSRKYEVEIISCAVGDGENDRSMLEVVDRPFFVRRPDGSHAEAKGIPVTAGTGPEGFTEAVQSIIREFVHEGNH